MSNINGCILYLFAGSVAENLLSRLEEVMSSPVLSLSDSSLNVQRDGVSDLSSLHRQNIQLQRWENDKHDDTFSMGVCIYQPHSTRVSLHQGGDDSEPAVDGERDGRNPG